MQYNAYTNTNDFPELEDYLPKDVFGKTNFNPMPSELRNAKLNYSNALNNWLIQYKIPQAIINEWIAATNSGNTEGFWQRMKQKYQTIKSNVTTFVQNNTPNLPNLFTKAALLPFKPLMVLALQKKGIPVSNSEDVVKIAAKFNDQIIVGAPYIAQRPFNNLTGSGEGTGDGGATNELVEKGMAIAIAQSPQLIEALIKQITKYIANLKAKKAAWQQLTHDENTIIETTINAPESEGRFSGNIKAGTIIIAIYAAYKIFFKK